jgi:hypothetical protein
MTTANALHVPAPTSDGPVRQRMIWNLTDPTAMTWRNEISFDGGPFSLVDEYEFTATGKGAAV